MSKSALVIIGASDAGKDQMSSFFIEETTKLHHTTSVIKWTDQYKRQLEFLYSLPFGSLNDKVFRAQHIRDPFGKKLDITYLDLMVKWSTLKDTVDPHFVTRNVVPIMINCPSDVLVLNDTRFPCEVDCLVQMRKRGMLDYLYAVKIVSHRQNPQESDKYLEDNWVRLQLFADKSRLVENNDSLIHLRSKTNTVSHELVDALEGESGS